MSHARGAVLFCWRTTLRSQAGMCWFLSGLSPVLEGIGPSWSLSSKGCTSRLLAEDGEEQLLSQGMKAQE